MSLAELASLSQVAAGLAVIVSLVFFGYELQLTRNQSELANWREVLKSLTAYKALTNDLEFAEFVIRGHDDYAALTPAEKLSFGLYLEQGVHIYGNFLKHNDSLPRKLTGLELALGNSLREMLLTKGGAAWWEEAHERGRFMPDTYVITDRMLVTASD
jgi:hypothetical protein